MLIRLSRTLFWVAACSAAVALLAPDHAGTWLTALAGIALLGSYACWRVAAARQRAEHLQAEAIAMVELGEAGMLDIATRLAREVSASPNLDAALLAALEVLRSELGLRDATVHRVLALEPPIARLASVIDAGPGGRGVEHRVRLEQEPLGVALRDHRVVGRDAGPFAVPIVRDGRALAVLALGEIALAADPAALADLFELVRLQLGEAARREAAGSADGAEPAATLLRDLPASVFVTDAVDHRLLDLSAQALQEFALRREAAIGRSVAEVFGAELAARIGPALQQAARSTVPIALELELAGPPAPRHLVTRHVAWQRAGAAPAVLSLVQDVSAERETRRELLESQSRAREFAATVGESVFVANPQRRHFEFIAASAFDTWGMTPEQFTLRPDCFLDNVIAEDRPLLAERQAAELRGESADICFRIDHPAKGRRWLRSRTHSRRRPDGSLRVYGMVSDVTEERARAADLERARDEAQAASAAKSQFMASMSHEIRTPMNGILGMTELLLGTALDDRQRRFAQAVYRSGEALLEIINDILDFSKIESGRLELALTEFAPRGIVEDTLDLLAARAQEKGLELSFREESGLPAVVHGDPLRLRQVLMNLVANAIKFTEYGEVVVDLRRGSAAAVGSAGESIILEFSVRDTGIGIASEVLPRLFSAFSQGSAGLARRYGGTGLGLAISRQLVELMGGTIDVRSAPGIGSEFRFTVPVRALPGAAAADPADGDLSALRVLVAEDNLTNRTVLEHMLGAWGMEVVLAEDGVEALERLCAAARPFDLALIDMDMPRLDGLGVARAVRESGLHAGLKLVLLSSVTAPDHARAAQEAGFVRFLAKPVRKAELRQALLGVTSSRADALLPPIRLERKVLVVEDNRVNQEVIGQMLRRLACRVQVVSGATEGLRALCEESFDLVLMDIQMPGMDGIEALHWFRRGGDGRFPFLTSRRTPVVAVTANALGGDEQRFRDLGFDDYLSKPFRQSPLLAMLLRHLSPPSAPVPAEDAPAAGHPPAAPAAGSVLDASALERLRELDPKGDNKLLERVMRAFETSVARLLPQLQEAQRLGDHGGIRHVVHTLKASSASIGALALSQQCAEIETRIRLGDADGLNARIEAVYAELEIVLKALRPWTDGKA